MTSDPDPQAAPSAAAISVALVHQHLQAEDRAGPVIHLDICDSTNAQAAVLGADVLETHGWALVVAEAQTAGRGRLDRSWVSEPGTGLLFSLAIGASRPPANLSVFPLLAGAAVARSCAQLGVPAQVKWPNDIVVVDGDRLRKLGGVLLERTATSVVVGVGLNVWAVPGPNQAPEGAALVDHGLPSADGIRERLLSACTAAIIADWEALVTGSSEPLLARYRSSCATLGRRVRALLPDGSSVEGHATEVDSGGRLVLSEVLGRSEPVALSVGDIVHLRGH